MLSKNSQYSRSVGEIKDQNKLVKSEKESLPQEIIVERVKLSKQKTGTEIKT